MIVPLAYNTITARVRVGRDVWRIAGRETDTIEYLLPVADPRQVSERFHAYAEVEGSVLQLSSFLVPGKTVAASFQHVTSGRSIHGLKPNQVCLVTLSHAVHPVHDLRRFWE